MCAYVDIYVYRAKAGGIYRKKGDAPPPREGRFRSSFLTNVIAVIIIANTMKVKYIYTYTRNTIFTILYNTYIYVLIKPFSGRTPDGCQLRRRREDQIAAAGARGVARAAAAHTRQSTYIHTRLLRSRVHVTSAYNHTGQRTLERT